MREEGKYKTAKHWSNAMEGWLNVKTGDRSGTLMSLYAAKKAKKKGWKSGKLIDAKYGNYKIYYFANEEAYDRWWKKGKNFKKKYLKNLKKAPVKRKHV
ncbi:MAG: hypothetical protein N3E51_05280 [Candidatus Micrarchaeota archaeon]|nr:hypothetical protein [Candidatus Micrarchaeota archaeon]